MAKAESASKLPVWTILCGTALIAGSAVFFFLRSHYAPDAPGLSPGRDILVNAIGDGTVDEQLLASLSWNDLAATAEGISADQNLRDQVIAITAGMQHPPALYLSALLLMAANDLPSALETFLLIPPTQIPPTHLYAPYRLHNGLRPSQPNPFLAEVNRAVAENGVPPLIQARVLAGQGRLPDALKAYLKTDPAEWTDLDLRALRGLRMHAGLANNTATMLLAALKGGRVPSALRPQLIEVLKAPLESSTMDDLKGQLLEQINRDPDIRRAALAGAEQQLKVRQEFVGRNYRGMLDGNRIENAMSLPDETVLMLVLSAARLQDSSAFDAWTQELTRRYPTPEVKQWIKELRAPSR